MNCNTCRYELSQCLDGRLPSGRRAVVMQHVESCEACDGFWSELQAAQALTMRLRPASVSSGFRDQLWERIHAGEGTPDAALHDTLTTWTKVRYTLTGAAAAALLLTTLTLLKNDTSTPAGSDRRDVVANIDVRDAGGDTQRAQAPRSNDRDHTPGGLQPRTHSAPPQAMRVDAAANYAPAGLALAEHPVISSANRLSLQLVAVETARQLEQRHTEVSSALRILHGANGSANGSRDAAIARAVENAREFQAFGELLLDLRDRERLVFTDSAVDADLRYAVQMLAHADKHGAPSLQTVESYVEPALRSERLGQVSHRIAMVPADPHEEIEGLLRLNTQRPEIFPKLFIVLPQAVDGTAFYMEGMCGPSWVAPRSEVESQNMLLRMIRRQFGDANVQIHIGVSPPEHAQDDREDD